MLSTCTPELLEQRDRNVCPPSKDAEASFPVEPSKFKKWRNELKRLHGEKLGFLEMETNVPNKKNLQRKVGFLQAYVRNLKKQIQMLVQTIEDLQRDEEPKVSDCETSHRDFPASTVDQRSLVVDELAAPGPSVTNTDSINQMGHMKVGKLENRKIPEKTKAVRSSPMGTPLGGFLKQKSGRSDSMLNNTGAVWGETRISQNIERPQRWRDNSSAEVERLQQELTRVRHKNEKKLQRKEMKMCTLLKELSDSKKQHSDCEKELLRRKQGFAELLQELDELRETAESRTSECARLNQTKEKLETELSLGREKLHTHQLEVRSRDQFIVQLREELKTEEEKRQETQNQVTILEEQVKQMKEKANQFCEKVKYLENVQNRGHEEQYHQLCVSQQQAKMSGEKVKKLETEMDRLCQQLKRANEKLQEADSENQEQKETVAIIKQKYSATMDKLFNVQGQMEQLEEELQCSQQRLIESQSETRSVKEDFVELERQYQQKVSQWESSQELLDQLTDELQANRNELVDRQKKMEHYKSLVDFLKEEIENLKQQKLMMECKLCFHQQNHSYPDDDYLTLSRLNEKLQMCCRNQADRLAECEETILQMKSARQAQEKIDVKPILTAFQHVDLSDCSQLEQEVTHLKKEVLDSKAQLSTAQKVQVMLLKQAEERLKEAKQESLRMNEEVNTESPQEFYSEEEEEEEMHSVFSENQSLRENSRQLRKELDDLRSQHNLAVEELAYRAEEARRMKGCLNDGKPAEEKMRLVLMRLEKEVAELRENMQLAADYKLKAEKEKETAQELVQTFQSKLEKMWSDNASLRHENKLIMKNVKHFIGEQKVSCESLAVQIKAQDELLLIIADEKEQLQVANDTLQAEVKRLKEVADEKEIGAQRFKAQIEDKGIQLDGKTAEMKSCAALKLNKIEDMRSRLQSNLEAISVLNQQLHMSVTDLIIQRAAPSITPANGNPSKASGLLKRQGECENE